MSGDVARGRAPTSAVYGHMTDWHTHGELLITGDGDIIGHMREVQLPVLSEEHLTMLATHIDNTDTEWRAMGQLHASTDQAQRQRAALAAVIRHNADKVCDLIRCYEDNVSQRSKLLEDITASIRDIEGMVKNSIYTEGLHTKH
jgi:hypothetical protein